MDIEELNTMWSADCKIDETNLSKESSRIPEIHNKYYIMYVKEGLRTKKLKSDLVELEHAKNEYYSGSMDEDELKRRGWKPNALKILRSDINRYVDSDKDIVNLSLKIAYQESLTKYLEDIVKQISNRNFIIKNIIDWSRFQAGGY